MSNVVTLTNFKTKKELEERASHDISSDEGYMYDALDRVLDTCDELADVALVILMIDGTMVSGATDNDKQFLMDLIAMATEELEGLEE